MSNKSALKLNPLRVTALLAAAEAIVVFVILVSIAPDPKNAILLGFSWKRWLMLAFVIAIIFSEINLFLNPQRLELLAASYLTGSRLVHRTEIWASLAAILLWLVIWFPQDRLGTFLDDYQRLLPVALLVLLISLQFFVVLQFGIKKYTLKRIRPALIANRRLIFSVAFITLMAATLFALLRIGQVQVDGFLPLLFPPSSILTGLQVFSVVVVFLFLSYFTSWFSLTKLQESRWLIVFFVLIWASAFLIWSQSPLTCKNDRPGPFPPNDVCYPPIDDAVYSVGSLYVGLGEGVYNHWLSDKPLYQVFLAAGQAIFGAEIDRYLLLQIAVLALIPALLFYFSARMMKFSGAPLLAALLVIKGYNEINLYPIVAGMNARIENTEGLMTLLIVLMAIFVFRWLQQPDQKRWAILAGGTLGAGILVRFNPVALIPILIFLFIWAARTQKKVILSGTALFLITCMLTVAPWFLSARDENGVSYYWIKIQEVINLRFNSATEMESLNGSSHLAKSLPLDTREDGPSFQYVHDFGVHYLNNVYGVLAELPINFKFSSGESITSQDLWKVDPRHPIWMAGFSTGNILAMAVNLILIVTGIFLSFRVLGLAGLSPLLIQLAYFIGNAAALTSGERYLLPVGWITLMYFCVGLLAAVSWAGRLVVTRTIAPLFQRESNPSTSEIKRREDFSGLQAGFVMALFLLIGASTYLVNFLPQKLPEATSPDLQQTAGQKIIEAGILSQQEWQTFTQQPTALVVAAKGYHPRFYRNPQYVHGSEFFEVMALGRDYVYVSQMLTVNPQSTFEAGSDVILVGCTMKQDEIWNSKRVIMRTNVLFQLNFESATYISGSPDWECKP